MEKKILKIVLLGNTNSGKSSLLNKIVGETVSVVNKKINTTEEAIKGIVNIKENQVIFIDTPGLNFLKFKDFKQKKFKVQLWQSIENSDMILYLIDSKVTKMSNIKETLDELIYLNKKIVLVFNKIDLIKKNKLLPFIEKLNNAYSIDSFFNISAKYNFGIKNLLNYLISFSKKGKWVFNNNEITNKNHIFITNECTRNAILTYLHKELPYNVNVCNELYKNLNNGDIKIKQKIIISNIRYKKIILGKNGEKIKKISKILNCKTHLYLQIVKDNA